MTGLCLLLGFNPTPSVQAQDPTPTPLFAPDSLGSILPDEVDGIPLLKISLPPGEPSIQLLSGIFPIPAFVNPLRTLAEEPAQARLAMVAPGDWLAAPQESPMSLVALRVEGIPGSDVADELIGAVERAVEQAVAAADKTFPPSFFFATETIDGQPVRVLRNADSATGIYVFATGEVAFMMLARGDASDPERPAAAGLAALRESVQVARSTRPQSAPQRVEFEQAGLAVSLPGDWRPAAGVLRAEDALGHYLSPDGYLGGSCVFDRGTFDGRVTFRLAEALAASWELPSPTLSRIPTAAGDALRVSWSEPYRVLDVQGLATTGTVYLLPWGDAIYSAACRALHEEGVPPEEDWLHIIETFEFLEQPSAQVSQEVVEATRELLCSIAIPIPVELEEAVRAHSSIPRADLATVRTEARQFFRRHGEVVKDFESPTTVDVIGALIDGIIEVPEDWFTGRLRPARVEKQLDQVSRGGTLRATRTRELITMFALACAAFDDPAVRADARRVAESAYHFGVTRRKRDPLRGWAYVNNQIDVELQRHGLEPCTPERDTVPTE